MVKFIFGIIASSFLFLQFNTQAFATENFATSYDATYQVLENGITQVRYQISLTNTSEQYYASSYKLELGFDDIINILASDPDGEIKSTIKKTENGYSLSLQLNKRVVGKGNSLIFQVLFQTRDVTQKQGNIWEVNILGLTNQDDFESFNVHVRVPSSFGKPTYIKPSQPNSTLDFTKEQLGKSGISLAFGENQVYAFELRYHLKNSNLFPIKTGIALPPSTNYQKVFIESIDPKPINVILDKDGNWLAQYQLLPSVQREVVVTGKAIISLYPRKQALSKEDRPLYLKEQPYWQTSNKKIKELAASLKTPDKIYQYVIKTLTYDLSRVTAEKPRQGAAEILENPESAVCLEFTDLFIALARAAGIPAREINGFAYTQNEKQRPLSLVKDILHAWPQYYDRELETWIMVDPTWGNTTGGTDYFHTFDFDHFAFVVKGVNSTLPIPAGGYKLQGQEKVRDVKISFSDFTEEEVQSFEIDLDIPPRILSGLPIEGFLTVRNISKTLLPSQVLAIESDTLTPEQQTLLFSEVPPYGFLKKSFSLEKTPILTNKTAIVTIRAGQKLITKTVVISPFAFTAKSIIGGAIVASLFVVLSIIAARAWGIPFFKQKR